MSEDFQSPGPPFAIRVLAHIMTGFYFIESVGATIVLWFYPSLAPEPRIHQYIASTPIHHSNRTLHDHDHHHHHHHHRHITHRKDRGSPNDSETYFAPSSSATDSSDPTTPKDDKVYISKTAGDTRELGLKQRASFEGGLPLNTE